MSGYPRSCGGSTHQPPFYFERFQSDANPADSSESRYSSGNWVVDPAQGTLNSLRAVHNYSDNSRSWKIFSSDGHLIRAHMKDLPFEIACEYLLIKREIGDV